MPTFFLLLLAALLRLASRAVGFCALANFFFRGKGASLPVLVVRGDRAGDGFGCDGWIRDGSRAIRLDGLAKAGLWRW